MRGSKETTICSVVLWLECKRARWRVRGWSRAGYLYMDMVPPSSCYLASSLHDTHLSTFQNRYADCRCLLVLALTFEIQKLWYRTSMSVFEYQKAGESGPCLLLFFFNISQIYPDCFFTFLWPGQNHEYWQSMLDFVASPKHTASIIMLRVDTCLKYGLSTLLVPLFFLFQWLRFGSQEIRASDYVCPPWLSKYEPPVERLHFCSGASKWSVYLHMSSILKHQKAMSHIAVFASEPQNTDTCTACLWLPFSGSKYSLFKSAQIFFNL